MEPVKPKDELSGGTISAPGAEFSLPTRRRPFARARLLKARLGRSGRARRRPGARCAGSGVHHRRQRSRGRMGTILALRGTRVSAAIARAGACKRGEGGALRADGWVRHMWSHARRGPSSPLEARRQSGRGWGRARTSGWSLLGPPYLLLSALIALGKASANRAACSGGTEKETLMNLPPNLRET